MAERGTAVIDELIEQLESGGFTVADVGARYRVTDPQGGAPTFIPKRIPKGASFTKVLHSLAAAGFDLSKARDAVEAKRQARLAKDKAKEQELLRLAEDAQRAREQAATAEPGAVPTPALRDPFAVAETVPRPRRATSPTTHTDGLKTEVIDMTPTFARELLMANRFFEEGATSAGKCNRRLSTRVAESYAQAMLRGEWVLTHQGIAFDVDGDLADGQHRLVAVVIAGMTNPDISVPMMITEGVPVLAFDRVDVGHKKSLGDILGTKGEVMAANLGAILRLVWLLDNRPDTVGSWRGCSVTAEQCLAMIEAEPLVREIAVRSHALNRVALPSAAGAAMTVLSRHWDAEYVADFVNRIRTGAELIEGSAAWALREQFLRQKGDRKYKRTQEEQLAMWLRAFGLHMEGKTRRGASVWKLGEPWPEVPTPDNTKVGSL